MAAIRHCMDDEQRLPRTCEFYFSATMENQKRKVWSSKMTARREILSKINSRSNSGTTRSVPDFSIQLPGPEYAADLETDKIEQFKSMLIQVHGTCDQVGKIEDVPESVTKYLSGIQAQLHAFIAQYNQITRPFPWHLQVFPKPGPLQWFHPRIPRLH
jgi:hypothetical protein